jgi:hypothetical protein
MSQITVDLYFHWIKRAERSRTLEVDRLMRQEVASIEGESEGGSFGGTRQVGVSKLLKRKGRNGVSDGFRTRDLRIHNPAL